MRASLSPSHTQNKQQQQAPTKTPSIVKKRNRQDPQKQQKDNFTKQIIHHLKSNFGSGSHAASNTCVEDIGKIAVAAYEKALEQPINWEKAKNCTSHHRQPRMLNTTLIMFGS